MILRKLIKTGHRFKSILPTRVAYAHSKAAKTCETPDETKKNRPTNLDLAKQFDKEEQENPFMLFHQLGVTTINRAHTFSVSCDRVIKYIKLGAINKNIVIQYCHYLAHLSRTCEPDDHAFYHKRCYDLFSYVLRHGKELSDALTTRLMCDVANSAAPNCEAVCNLVMQKHELIDKMYDQDFAKLLAACYKFGLWELANKFIITLTGAKRSTSMRSYEPMVEAFIEASKRYSSLLDTDSFDGRELFRETVLENLLKLLERGQQVRAPFVTKLQPKFIKSLEDFDINVVKSPTIKSSGRCTNCNSRLPIFDSNSTNDLHISIGDLLRKRIDSLYVHANESELEKFEELLSDMSKTDNRPIDCVIDGPNVAYKNSIGYYYVTKNVNEDFQKTERRHDPSSQVRVLINTIIRGGILQNFKKILVIGRSHMIDWPGLLDFFKQHKIYYFFPSNNSKDDLFQLYASTVNANTTLITNDFFRDHLALLDGEARIRLERWIDTHQAWVLNKNLKTVLPTQYEKIPSVDKNGHFHIPVIDYYKLDGISLHEPPPHLNNKMLTWICCRKKQIFKIDSGP